MKENIHGSSAYAVRTMSQSVARTSHFEWRVVVIPRDVSRADARVSLAHEAEYGQWELARTVMYEGGMRKVWLRRRTMRVRRTDAP